VSSETVPFLLRHGYLVLFVWVCAEQMGLPIPAIPVLLAAGALARSGQLTFLTVVGLAVVASLLSDFTWYAIGRRRGSPVLKWLCRISLEPDSCVRRTENLFARNGARSLLWAKFLPGLSTVAPPLAGIFRMRLARFLLFDGAGALVWAGGFAALGYLFSYQHEPIGVYAARMGGWLVVILAAALAAYIGWKYLERHRFLRELRIARITPEELKQRLDSGEEITILDLRQSLDFEADPETLPGAVHFDPDQLDHRHNQIPRDRSVVLYCT
jgi:membrane protein DedA with SNARE-associated domain